MKCVKFKLETVYSLFVLRKIRRPVFAKKRIADQYVWFLA